MSCELPKTKTKKKPWVVPCLNAFFESAQNFAPENQTALVLSVFSTGCLGLPSHPFSIPSLPLFIVFFPWWIFEAWEEPFQNSKYFPDIFGTYWEQIKNNWFQISFFFNPFLWVKWIWSHPNRMENHPWIEIAPLNLPSTTPYFLFQEICKGVVWLLLEGHNTHRCT